MKKIYSKPMIEIEAYQLSASIAANCTTVVTLGPGGGDYDRCDEFKDSFDVLAITPGVGILSENGKPFYSDGTATCTCYHSSGGGLYFTS